MPSLAPVTAPIERSLAQAVDQAEIAATCCRLGLHLLTADADCRSRVSYLGGVAG